MRTSMTVLSLVVALLVAACSNLASHPPLQPVQPCDSFHILGLDGLDQDEGTGFLDDPWSVRLTLEQKAREGNPQAAYCLYYLSTTAAEQREWMCRAANLGLPTAQEAIARLYWLRPWEAHSPFPRDIIKAFVWSHQAIRSGRSMQRMAKLLAMGMTAAQRTKAASLLSRWRPDPDGCGGSTIPEALAVNHPRRRGRLRAVANVKRKPVWVKPIGECIIA